MSLNLRKTLAECEPFKDGAASVVCIGCFKLMTFPSGAKKVMCPNCETTTTGIKIKCTSCATTLQAKFGTNVVTCRKCGYSFTPMSKLKIHIPQNKRTADIPVPIEVKVVVDSSVHHCETRVSSMKLIGSQPLRSNATYWEDQLAADFKSVQFFLHDKSLDSKQTPKQLKIKSGDTITIKQVTKGSSSGHEFTNAQFGQPTNCAACKKFIWGIYHQGKKCAKCQVPVHHRCEGAFNGLCEADLRQMFGIVNFNDEDDEGEEEVTIAVIVSDDDKEAFANMVEEAVEPECDVNFMAGLNKLSNFTDEQIQEMWIHYDKDESGSLERDEMRCFMADLLGIKHDATGNWLAGPSGESVTMEDQIAAVDKMMVRLDTNGDGCIDWEEFWYFVKAQQDGHFLDQFSGESGVELTTDQLYEMWYHYDADGSGELEADEMISVMQDLCQLSQSRDVKLEFQGDSNFQSLLGPSKKVSWDEFHSIIVPFIQKGLA